MISKLSGKKWPQDESGEMELIRRTYVKYSNNYYSTPYKVMSKRDTGRVESMDDCEMTYSNIAIKV